MATSPIGFKKFVALEEGAVNKGGVWLKREDFLNTAERALFLMLDSICITCLTVLTS